MAAYVARVFVDMFNFSPRPDFAFSCLVKFAGQHNRTGPLRRVWSYCSLMLCKETIRWMGAGTQEEEEDHEEVRGKVEEVVERYLSGEEQEDRTYSLLSSLLLHHPNVVLLDLLVSSKRTDLARLLLGRKLINHLPLDLLITQCHLAGPELGEEDVVFNRLEHCIECADEEELASSYHHVLLNLVASLHQLAAAAAAAASCKPAVRMIVLYLSLAERMMRREWRAVEDAMAEEGSQGRRTRRRVLVGAEVQRKVENLATMVEKTFSTRVLFDFYMFNTSNRQFGHGLDMEELNKYSQAVNSLLQLSYSIQWPADSEFSSQILSALQPFMEKLSNAVCLHIEKLQKDEKKKLKEGEERREMEEGQVVLSSLKQLWTCLPLSLAHRIVNKFVSGRIRQHDNE
eukprot:660345-Hanusia_phi.AAC.4